MIQNISTLMEMKDIKKLKKFMKELMPKNAKYVKKYRGKIPLFHDALIETEA